MKTAGRDAVDGWLGRTGRTLAPFQVETRDAVASGCDGLVTAPTGSGKTLAVWLPLLAASIDRRAASGKSASGKSASGKCASGDAASVRPTEVLWITPLRALAADVARALASAADGVGADIRVDVRTGDTTAARRSAQSRRPPDVLVTTPESIHVMLSQPGHASKLGGLLAVIVDEWHELLGSKRGVQTELALARLRAASPGLLVWGLSATIGNPEYALAVLTGGRPGRHVRSAGPRKEVVSETLLPTTVERFPWSGHIGLRLSTGVAGRLRDASTSIVFTNTRAQSELWHRELTTVAPELAPHLALHHGSLDRDERDRVEAGLRDGSLRAVVATSGLDLGVDFSPVDAVVQVGSPKSVARYLQRAGRSGHRPGEASRVTVVPTNALEIIEALALEDAVRDGVVEPRSSLTGCVDVLVQYVCTLAASDGFRPAALLSEIRSTHAYASLDDETWRWILDFVSTGGKTLYSYDDYRKVVPGADGVWRMPDAVHVRVHRFSIGTIVSDAMVRVKLDRGGPVGSVEESFAARLRKGDTFWLGGRHLEFRDVRDMTMRVKRATGKGGIVPRWGGSRHHYSSEYGRYVRAAVADLAAEGGRYEGRREHAVLKPLLRLQAKWSHLPAADDLLIERVETREGRHLFIYPFEGRDVHEGLAVVLAGRLARRSPATFSVAASDHGFELLSRDPFPETDVVVAELCRGEGLEADLAEGINLSESAKRRFREIARVACLVFPGYPGRSKAVRHVQASAGLIYGVFEKYDPDNLLLLQAREEVLRRFLGGGRLASAAARLRSCRVTESAPPRPTPFGFPILTERLREKVSNESASERIAKMAAALERAAG